MCHPTPPRASIEYVGHGDRPRRSRGRQAAHGSAAPQPRHAPAPGREGRCRGAPRRRRGADLAPALRPPRHALAAAPRPRDARRRAAGRGRADQAQGRRHERHRDARRRGDPDRRPDGARRSRRARHRPAAVRRPRRAARLRDRGRRPLGLLRRRHGRLPGHGGARAGRRRAAPDLGLGADDGAGPHGSGPGRRGGRAARSAPRDPDPLGHVLPRSTSGCGDRRHSCRRPPPLFEQAVRERSPATEVRVLQPGERTTI